MPNKPAYNPINLQSLIDHHSSLESDLQEIRAERLQAGLETSGSVWHISPQQPSGHRTAHGEGHSTEPDPETSPFTLGLVGRLYQLTALEWESRHCAPIVPVEVAADQKK